MSRALLIFLSALAVAACDTGQTRVSAGEPRDSAGVRIVENPETGGSGGTGGWRVSDAPLLDLGAARGGTVEEFDQVAATLRLSDGRIVVANAGSGELRFYDSSGRRLASAGRRGSGPGEYQGITSVERLEGDSLLVYDRRARRLSWHDRNGRFVKSVQVDAGIEGFPEYVGRLSGGALLMTRRRDARVSPPQGLVRDSVALLRVEPGSSRADSIASLAGEEQAVLVQGTTINRISLPYMRRTRVRTGGSGFWVGTTDDYALEWRRGDGTVEMIVRREHRPEPVGGAYMDSLRAVQRRAYGEEAGRALDQFPAGDALPAFGELLVDDARNLWVERFPWPGQDRSRWDVFGSDGRLVGSVAMPARFRLMQPGRDFVLGVWRDESDVEHVRMHRLSRP
jgi:hypothetical protein